MTSYRTPRAQVSGLGSARTGTGHFWEQRITAVALLFLAPVFILTFAHNLGGSYDEIRAAYAQPFNAIVALAFMLTAFLHLFQGLIVIVEDYVHGRKGTLLIIAIRLLTALFALAGSFAILKIAFSA